MKTGLSRSNRAKLRLTLMMDMVLCRGGAGDDDDND